MLINKTGRSPVENRQRFIEQLARLCAETGALLASKIHNDSDDESYRGEEWSFVGDEFEILVNEELQQDILQEITELIAVRITAEGKILANRLSQCDCGRVDCNCENDE